MSKTYLELQSDDPAWSELAASAKSASNDVEVLPCVSEDARRACLEGLQVTTRSTLGALAYETGGVLVDHGWLRIFGSGHPKLSRALGAYNKALGIDVGECLFVADDAVGGVFAIDAGPLGDPGKVHYFAPDTLAWESTEIGHSAWIDWAFTGDLAKFYEAARWPGWEKEVAALTGEQSISIWPGLWTEEGQDPAKASRKAVAATELWALYQKFARELAG